MRSTETLKKLLRSQLHKLKVRTNTHWSTSKLLRNKIVKYSANIKQMKFAKENKRKCPLWGGILEHQPRNPITSMVCLYFVVVGVCELVTWLSFETIWSKFKWSQDQCRWYSILVAGGGSVCLRAELTKFTFRMKCWLTISLLYKCSMPIGSSPKCKCELQRNIWNEPIFFHINQILIKKSLKAKKMATDSVWLWAL